MKINYLSKSDINKLRAELMGKRKRNNKVKRNDKSYSSNSKHSVSNISSQYFLLRNDEIGQDFEENIRNILIMDYNWKERNIKRKFKFREIHYRLKKLFIITGQKKSVFINHRIILFQFNDDGSIDITNKCRTITIRDQEEKSVVLIKVGVITLKKVQEVEIDGMFHIENFSSSTFDTEEIIILYRNIDDKKMKLFNQAVLEMKLSKKNFSEMVTQLNRDRDVFEKIIKDPILYIGFINSKNIGKNELNASKDGLNKLKNCIIFGIKNKIFSGKNVNKFYNWKGMEKINKLEEDVNLLGNEVKQLKNLFLNFVRQYEINNKNIFDILNQMNIEQNRNNSNNSFKICNVLKRKRKRGHN